jgi:hypothetical protein
VGVVGRDLQGPHGRGDKRTWESRTLDGSDEPLQPHGSAAQNPAHLIDADDGNGHACLGKLSWRHQAHAARHAAEEWNTKLVLEALKAP